MVTSKEFWHLVWPYTKTRVLAQLRLVAFIVIYLVLFQVIALRLPLQDALMIASGIGLVVTGLAFFMEGLVLGLMPLGESIGLRLPGRTSLASILLFSFLLGIGATFAEPAIGVLRAAGSSVDPNVAPLLSMLLNEKSDQLVFAVAFGVGVAVVLGMLRFLRGWSLKPLLYVTMALLLSLTAYCAMDQQLATLLGLAWDCGAVTTGPVTVPLVLALGIGVSRVTMNARENSGDLLSGFGVVTLASLLPVISVLGLGIFHAHVSLTPSGEWPLPPAGSPDVAIDTPDYLRIVSDSLLAALRAILPLSLFMIVVFRFLLKESFVYFDEIVLGLVFAIVGMTLLNLGIEFGLRKLGNQVGENLPAAYSTIELKGQSTIITNFDRSSVNSAVTPEGGREEYIMLKEHGRYYPVPFDSSRWNEAEGIYHVTTPHGPLFGLHEHEILGFFVVLCFAFLMGYGATLAEPALNALGATVETLTVGTFKKNILMQSVSVGVGLGILLGVIKIIWDLPLALLLIPSYLVLLVLTHYSSEDFVNIAWDSAGVTTGPITVPLVLAMGLGIGSQSGVSEGFGILAMASVCPILCVLVMGLFVTRRRQRLLDDLEEV